MGNTNNTIIDWVAFVNTQSTYHKNQIERLSRRSENGKPERPEFARQKANHQRIAAQLDQLAEFISSGAHSKPADETSPSKAVSASLHIIPEDLEGLPKELLAELNISESDELELEIFAALKKAGGTLPVDKILIQLYRDTGKVHPRNKIAAKLYRMAAKNRLIASEEHRGVYTLPENGLSIGTQNPIDSYNGVEDLI